MNFKTKIALHILGFSPESELPETAILGLEEGYNSESLITLAGLNKSASAFELDDYFKRTLKEIGFHKMDEKMAVKTLISHYAKQVQDGTLDPYKGYDSIDSIFGRTAFSHDDFGLFDAYVDYISIWEVRGDGLRLHEGENLSKEDYITLKSIDLRNNLSWWLMDSENV